MGNDGQMGFIILRYKPSILDFSEEIYIHIFYCSYSFEENASTLSEHTNDGHEENVNLVSMNVEHYGDDLKHSKPNPSSKYILTCLFHQTVFQSLY